MHPSILQRQIEYVSPSTLLLLYIWNLFVYPACTSVQFTLWWIFVSCMHIYENVWKKERDSYLKSTRAPERQVNEEMSYDWWTRGLGVAFKITNDNPQEVLYIILCMCIILITWGFWIQWVSWVHFSESNHYRSSRGRTFLCSLKLKKNVLKAILWNVGTWWYFS